VADFKLVPESAALLNIDLQNCFVEGADPGREVLHRMNQLASVCRDAGILVIHTRQAIRRDHANIGILGQLVPAVRDGMLDDGSESAAFHPDLWVDPHDVVLTKPRFGAFHGTDLELILRSRGIDSVIIGGLTTDVCCDTTAREANVRDFKVFFLSDATKTPRNSDEVQRSTLQLISELFGQVLTTDAMIAKINRTVAKRRTHAVKERGLRSS
jgi:ureidoacrylate peracid hydrolase